MPSSPSIKRDALQALEALFLANPDLMGVTLDIAGKAAQPDIRLGLVWMDQDDNGKPCLTDPIPAQELHEDGAWGKAAHVFMNRMASLASTPENHAALRAVFPSAFVEIDLTEVRHQLAELELSSPELPRQRVRSRRPS